MHTRPLLESIVSSLDDARAASAAADRFELCSALALGGLTPSLGLLQAVKRGFTTPVMCMIRPRESGMAYTENEFQTMLADAEIALAAGADGLVFGLLTDDGEIDIGRCRQFLEVARRSGRAVETVFHRAFDIVKNPEEALSALIDLGLTRVLTSGRAADALAGAAEIRRTIEQADHRIEVLPGGGIKLSNLAEVVRRSGADQVHVYLTEQRKDPSTIFNPEIRFGAQLPADDNHHLQVSESMVLRARQVLDLNAVP